MQYLLLIYFEEQTLPDADRERCYRQSAEYAHELSRAGKYITCAPLYSTATATSVRVNESKRMITDGPFAETREQLGGFFMVDARDLDEAIEIAAGLPGAKFGTVEVRPVLEVPHLPESFSARAVETAPLQAI